MKIGILTNSYPPNLNGVSISVEALYTELTKQGHEVFLATPGIKKQKYPKNILALRSVELPKNLSPDLKLPYLYLNSLKNFFKKNQVEIIHTHDTFFGGIEGAMLGLILKIPTVHTFHTMVEDYNYFKIPGYKRMISTLVKDICNQYNHLISPSQKIYDYLLEKGVKIPISQISNVVNLKGLGRKVTAWEIQEMRKKLGINQEDFVFITFCRIAQEKGLENSIKVLQNILLNNSKVKYLIAGWGPYSGELKKLVVKLKLEKQVIFYGRYDRRDLPLICKISHVFLFTSKTENQPTNIWEAMYLGLPVISIDDSSVDYILKPGFNGFKNKLTNLEKVCLDILTNTDLKKLSKNASVTAKNSSPEKIAKQHIDLYKQIIDEYKKTNFKYQNEPGVFQLKKFFDSGVVRTLESVKNSYRKFLSNLEIGD